MSRKNFDTPAPMVDETQIIEHLLAHPDFFTRHPDALEALQLPHETGSAISLVERQVSVLRERNLEMRQRLNNLLTTARENDKLFEKTKRLVLTLIEANSLGAV